MQSAVSKLMQRGVNVLRIESLCHCNNLPAILRLMQECGVSSQCGVREHREKSGKYSQQHQAEIALTCLNSDSRKVHACSLQVKEDGSVRPRHRLFQELLDRITQLD